MAVQRPNAKTYTKTKLREQTPEVQYWQSQTAEQRLATLEQIRNEYHARKQDPQPNFKGFFHLLRENLTLCTAF